MSPFTRAAHCHERLGSSWSFAQVVEAHAQAGHVVVTPEICLLFRGVRREWDERELCDPLSYSPEPDTWHVWLAAGDFRQALRWMPYPLPWVSFHRHGRLKVMGLGKLDLVLRRSGPRKM